MTNCLLINPQVPFATPASADAWIKHGLASLSASLKQAGHSTSLLDFRLIPSWGSVIPHVARINPDVVFITAVTSERDAAITTAKMIKRYDPNIVTCVGGIHASIAPQDFWEGFDFIIKGEGEITVPNIASELKETPKWAISPVVQWGKVPDLNTIPHPDRELWPDYMERCQHPPLWLREKPWVDILNYRGCSGKCKFCVGPGEQNHFKPIRGKSVERVIDEMLILDSKYHFKSYNYGDDQAIMNVQWMWDFCKALKENGLDGKQWWAGSRADVILRNKDLVLEMQRRGLDIMSVGFESFSQHHLDFWNKGTTVEQNVEAAMFLKDHGIRIFSNVIFGAPREDGKYYPEDDRKNIEMLQKIRPEFNSWSIFTATPGCELYKWAQEKNLIVANDNGWRGANENKVRGVSVRRVRLLGDEAMAGQINSRPWYHTWHDRFRLLLDGD